MIQENFRIKNRITAGFFLTFPVNWQSFQVLDRCWAATKATWNMEFVWDTGKRFWQSTFCVRFVTDTLSRNSSLCESKCHRCNPGAGEYRGHLSREVKNELGARLQCRCLKEGRQPRILLGLEIPRISMAGQQSLQISELQFDKFTTSSKPRWVLVPIFHRKPCCGSREVEMVDSVDEFISSRSIEGTDFPNFLNCWTRELLLLWIRSSRVLISRRRSVWEEQIARKKGSVSSWMTDLLHDLRLLSSHWCPMIPFLIMLIYSQPIFATMMFRNSIRDGMKFFHLWPRSQLMMYWKVCTNWDESTWVSSTQNRIGIVWKFIKRYRCPIIKNWRRWWKGVQIKTSITKFWLQEWENWERCSGQESKGNERRWRRKRSLQISGQQKCNVRRETSAVSGTTRISVQNRHRKPLHSLNHQHKEVEVRRTNRTSEAGVHLGSSLDSRAKTTWKLFAPNHFVTIGESQFYESKLGCKFGDECSFPHWKVEEQPNERPTKGGDKSAVAVVKDVRQLGCVSQDTDPPESSAILRKGTKVLGPIRRVRFTRTALRQANIREDQGSSLKTSSSAQSLEAERQERCARGDAWSLAKTVSELKEKDKTTFFSPTDEWIMPAACTKNPEEREFVVDSGAGMHTVSRKDL